MNVLVDVRHLRTGSPSGVGRYTLELLHALLPLTRATQYTLLTTGRTPTTLPETLTQLDHVTHTHVPTSNKWLNLNVLSTKRPQLSQLVATPIDHIFMPNMNIVSLPNHIPVTLTMHDCSWHDYPQFYSKKMQWWHKACQPDTLVDRVNTIVVPSRATKQDLKRLFPESENKVQIIPHGVDHTFSPHMQATDHGVRSRYKLPKQFVLFVGTIEPRKNLTALIKGVHDYRTTTRDDLHLVIAGNDGWNTQDIKRLMNRAEHKSWIQQIGYIAQTDLPALYRSAQATVFPSIYEGFGLPVLESLACGTPVITSHTSSLPEAGGSAAIYIDPYNHTDITIALKELLHSTTLQQQLRTEGIRHAATFTWKRAATQLAQHMNLPIV